MNINGEQNGSNNNSQVMHDNACLDSLKKEQSIPSLHHTLLKLTITYPVCAY